MKDTSLGLSKAVLSSSAVLFSSPIPVLTLPWPAGSIMFFGSSVILPYGKSISAFKV